MLVGLCWSLFLRSAVDLEESLLAAGHGDTRSPARFQPIERQLSVLEPVCFCLRHSSNYLHLERQRSPAEPWHCTPCDAPRVVTACCAQLLSTLLHQVLAVKSATVDFEFDSLGLKLPGPHGKVILSGVTGTIQHGRVTAVMGPSGAGRVLPDTIPRWLGTVSISHVCV